MTFTFSPISYIFLANGLICIILAAAFFTRRPSPGAIPLTLLTLAIATWTLPAAFEAGAADLATRIICNKISYIGLVSTGVFWLAFALDYSGSNWWKRPRNFALISLVPLITLAITWTNELTGWQWSGVSLINGPWGATTVYGHGPWFLVNPIYEYGLYLCGIVILYNFGLKRARIYRKPVIIGLAGTAIPLIGSVLYVAGVKLANGLDLSPFYISAAALIYCVTIFRYRFIDVVPVAYQVLLKNIPDGVLVLDRQSNVVETNPAAERIMGKNNSVLRGRPLAVGWPELDKAVSSLHDMNHAEMKTENTQGPIYLDIKVQVLEDNHHKFVGSLVMLRDISVLKKAQFELKGMYETEHELRNDLDQEIEKRSQYSRAIVHELKTPLTSILACSELLEDQVKEEVETKLVQNIRRASSSLLQRVNELFELARGELGLIDINPESLEMNGLIQEIVAEMSPLTSQKGILLRSELPESSRPVSGEPGRLRQVLTNLVSNAIKFTEHGEILIVADSNDPDFLHVRVSDTGSGMSEEQLADLFDPYRRKTIEGKKTSGLGIGLALSKLIVELHGGKIWAESTAGKGTSLNFTLPYARISDPQEKTPADMDSLTGPNQTPKISA